MDVVTEGLTAHIVIVEKTTMGNVSYNGESHFYKVMMKMLPDANGITLSISNAGDSETVDVSFDMSQKHMEGPDDLSVIVFVQDDTDMSIVQSEYGDIAGEFDTHVVTLQVQDALGNAVDGAEVFLEGYGFQETDAMGTTVFPEVFNGDFDYYVTFPRLLDSEGSFQLSDNDESVTVVLGIPDYLF
ncbi:MAG: hypothetical protein ACI81Y_002042 [Glaciecola sp.]|jgi:hypothetical protein